MIVKIMDPQVKKLAEITYTCIFDDESFDLALSRFFQMYNNQQTNIAYLQDVCKKNGINTPIS